MMRTTTNQLYDYGMSGYDCQSKCVFSIIIGIIWCY